MNDHIDFDADFDVYAVSPPPVIVTPFVLLGRCGVCEHLHLLNKSGTLARHNNPSMVRCSGAGGEPEELVAC